MAAAGPIATSLVVKLPKDNLFVCSNERGQKGTHLIMKGLFSKAVEGDARNAMYGCGCFFILDIASDSDKVTRLGCIDLSDKTENFWKGMMDFIPDLDPNDLDEAQAMVKAYIKMHGADLWLPDLETAIRDGLSWLSTKERFKRIWKIFKDRHATFTKGDMGNPEQFGGFLKGQAALGAKPFGIFVSNCASRTTAGTYFAGQDVSVNVARYKAYHRSMSLIPLEVAVIDSEELTKEDDFSTQRIYLPGQDRGKLLPSPMGEVFVKMVNADDYEGVRCGIEHGADLTVRHPEEGHTLLMSVAQKGLLNSLKAFLESGKVDVNERSGKDQLTAMQTAALGDQPEAIRILASHRADIEAVSVNKQTALHHAVAKGHVKATRELLELGATRLAKDISGEIPAGYLQGKGYTVYGMKQSNPPVFKEIQRLLKKGCAPKPVQFVEKKEQKKKD